MADFRTVFNVSELDEQSLGMIEFVLNSPAYADYFEPYLLRMRESLNHSLLDPAQARKDALPDDFIRGGIGMIDGLTKFFRKLIDETRMERIARAQGAITSTDSYTILRATGRARGNGQVEQPLQPGEGEPVEFDASQDF